VFRPKRGAAQIMVLQAQGEGEPAAVIAVLTVQSDLTETAEETFAENVARAIGAAQLPPSRR
jgi:hypothetical protein